MEIYHLKTFNKVAEFGNLTRAAENLFTSQPAVSAHIKALEDEFGLKLFDRTAKGMKLTKAGENLLEDAQEIIKSSHNIFQKAVSLRSEISGALRVGINNSGEVLRSGPIFTNLARNHPQLTFDISRGDSGDILSGIESGELDVGFFEGKGEHSSVEYLKIGEIELCVAVPESRFEQLKDEDWAKMSEQTWMLGSPRCSYRGVFKMLAEEKGLNVTQRIMMNDDSLLLDFVENDLALSIAPRRSVERLEAENSRVRVWPHFRHAMPLSVAFLKSRGADPAVGAFVKEAQGVWAN